jgi:hypothetical protein
VDYTHEGGGTRLVIVVLRRENGRWAIDDLLYEDGSTFRGILSTG